MRNRLLMAAKIAVSMLSLYFVIRAVDLSSVTSAISNIKPGFVVVALAVFWIAQIVSALRCVYIADELGRDMILATSVKAHFIGLWFNQVLPTSLGGDVLKVVVLKPTIGMGVALRTILLDRFSGLFILMLAIAVTLPLYSQIIPPGQSSLLFGLNVLSIGFLAATLVFAWATTVTKKYLNPAPLLSKFLSLVSDIWRFRKGRSLWRQLWTSTIVHLNGIAAYALLGIALGFDVNLITFALIVPLVFLVALLPISFAGWGVREAGAIWLFGLVGIPKENALILSVAYGAMLIFAGIPGLVMFIRGKHHGS